MESGDTPEDAAADSASDGQSRAEIITTTWIDPGTPQSLLEDDRVRGTLVGPCHALFPPGSNACFLTVRLLTIDRASIKNCKLNFHHHHLIMNSSVK